MMIPIETEFDRLFRLVSKQEAITNPRLIKKTREIRNHLTLLRYAFKRKQRQEEALRASLANENREAS